MRIVRVLNNNAAVVADATGAEAVVLGKGIAHGRRRGETIDESVVEQSFRPDTDHPVERLAQTVSELPLEVVDVARRAGQLAHERLGVRVTQALVLSIADHLAFAVQRAAEGIVVDFPLRWEVTQLYPAELAIGQEAVRVANARLGVVLPADEAGALALHLVNAAFATDGLHSTIRMTERIAQVLEVVGVTMGLRVDPESMSASRFVTHLRYLFVRVDRGRQLSDAPEQIVSAVRETHPREYACAVRVRHLLEVGGARLSEDELTYLALHLARLVADARGE